MFWNAMTYSRDRHLTSQRKIKCYSMDQKSRVSAFHVKKAPYLTCTYKYIGCHEYVQVQVMYKWKYRDFHMESWHPRFLVHTIAFKFAFRCQDTTTPNSCMSLWQTTVCAFTALYVKGLVHTQTVYVMCMYKVQTLYIQYMYLLCACNYRLLRIPQWWRHSGGWSCVITAYSHWWGGEGL